MSRKKKKKSKPFKENIFENISDINKDLRFSDIYRLKYKEAKN